MTDVTTEATSDTENWDAPERDAEAYPEMPANPHNHVFTISMDGRGPMIVVRGNTPEEVNERFQALQDAGTTAIAASVYSHMKAEMLVAQGLGPVTAAPPAQGAPAAPPAFPVAPPQGQFNQQPAQQFPGQAGQAPAAWQNAGAPAQAAPQMSPEYQQAGWYKLNVPFKQKPQFDGIVAQYGFRKGRPTEGGQFSFQKADKSWYCAPDIAGAFPQFSPVPA